MMTLPWDANSNQGIALVLGVKVSTVDKQVERIFKRVRGVGGDGGPVHSRMELAQRVDAEIVAMRGWGAPSMRPAR